MFNSVPSDTVFVDSFCTIFQIDGSSNVTLVVGFPRISGRLQIRNCGFCFESPTENGVAVHRL